MKQQIKAAAKPDLVPVRLLCILSGEGESWGIGDVVSVDAKEAARLIALGAAAEIQTK